MQVRRIASNDCTSHSWSLLSIDLSESGSIFLLRRNASTNAGTIHSSTRHRTVSSLKISPESFMFCSKTGEAFRDFVWFDPEMTIFCAMCCYDYIPLMRCYSLTGFRPSRVRFPQSMHCQRCRCCFSRLLRICARLNLVAHLAEQKRSRCGGTGRPSKGHRGWVDSAEARLLVMAKN